MILPFTVLRRLDCVLEATKPGVLREHEARQVLGAAAGPFLTAKSGPSFFNTSPMDFAVLQGDAPQIKANLLAYVNAFSENVRDVFERFDFAAMVEKLDALRCAVVICDEKGRMVVANAVAAEEMKDGACVTTAAGGVLSLASVQLRDRLRKAIGRAASGEAGCLPVARTWPLPPVILNCAPLPRQGAAKRILVIWEPSRYAEVCDVPPAALCTALGLTTSEARVALLIADGCSTEQVAERLGVQPNTVRTHLKRIFSKTGSTGRADLARLVLCIVTSLRVLRPPT